MPRSRPVLLITALLALAVTSIVGTRSYWRTDVMRYERRSYRPQAIRTLSIWVVTGRGGVGLGIAQADADDGDEVEPIVSGLSLHSIDATGYPFIPDWNPSWPNRLGFAFDSVDTQNIYGRYREWTVAGPLWLIGLIFGSPLLWALGKALRHRRRRAAGRCIHCGYDLRATPDRCPECGRVPERCHAGMISDDKPESL